MIYCGSMKSPKCILKRPARRFRSTENALRVSELRYRRLFETAQAGILILDAESGEIDDVNPFLTDMLGYSREQLVGNKFWEINPFKKVEASKVMFREVQRKPCVRYDDLPLETSNGRVVNVEFVSNVYQVNGNRVVQCNLRDITKRRRTEKKLKDYSHKLQVLSHRLVEVQETERRNIARELHDEIGQALTVIQLNLQALLQSPNAGNELRLQESLVEVERVLEQVRDLALNLRPSMLDDLGLETALCWFITRQASLVGLRAQFHSDPLKQRLDLVIETECFRVAQEAITNVVRHAHAKTMSVELRREAGRLHLRVRDDGIGFDARSNRERAVRGESLGLLSMEERAALAGGGLEFKSAVGGGTEVHAWFPLKWRAPAVEHKTV